MPMRKRKSNFFGDVGVDAMRPVETARCGECDGRDGADNRVQNLRILNITQVQ
jgi:hypothetical protein